MYMALPMKELSSFDFKATEIARIRYSKGHVKRNHQCADEEFELKDYCPSVFRYLQELDDIDYTNYMQSVCSHETLMEISSSGKSGRRLLLSKDDQFVIKTLRKPEMKVLREMLPKYLRHITRHRSSLLIKFYGLHVVRTTGGLKVYFAVMDDLLQPNMCIHRLYDLKGSSQGRTVTKASDHGKTILKDFDLDFCFHLDPLVRHQLLAQIKYDCEFLEAEDIMGYSFLLGVHIEAPYQDSPDDKNCNLKNTSSREVLREHTNSELTFADFCQKHERSGSKFSAGIPARAFRMPRNQKENTPPPYAREYKAVLYFGIIDILKGYNFRKRLEHAYKSMQFDSKLISAVNPKVYSDRIQNFLSKVFVAEEIN